VILAAELRAVAARQRRQQAVAVGADVLESEVLAAEVADQQRPIEQVHRQEVAVARQLGLRADQVPCGKEQPVDLRPELLFRGVVFRPQKVLKLVLVDEHGVDGTKI
jgi:hypothetical protein